ncbi:MAG: DsrE family protein [Acidobacteria bacterium]|nr:DsrE family protein [Acidobacteriota bacterium]
MAKILLFALALACIPACAPIQAPEPAARPAARDGAFIHITAGINDPHRVAMALQMAAVMAEDRDVLVYFDIKGIEIVLKDSPDIAYAQFPGSKAQLASLAEKGITIAACPGCLKAAGKTEADLAEGVTLAEKAEFFNFTQGRIFTLDY